MIFISLVKFRKKTTKESIATTDRVFSALQKQGVKIVASYWTLGNYDAVHIFDVPDEGAVKRIMKAVMDVSDYVAPETLVALKREDAIKLLD